MNPTLFDSYDRYILTDFQHKKPFSSFLPGIAGLMGAPLWVFYANRGQGITSFGVEDKDHPMMEFQPAHKAYQMVSYTGFRTFIKVKRSGEAANYEPFSTWDQSGSTQREMFIGMNELEIREINPEQGLQVNVLYFILPGESFPALVRQVTIKNLGGAPVELEVVDGMPAVIPYGLSNGMLKEIGRTMEAWMEVAGLEEKIPFYRLRASPADTIEVATIEKGFFALAFESQHPGDLFSPIVDIRLLFGEDTGLFEPSRFYKASLAEVLKIPQAACGRTPSAFLGKALTCPANGSTSFVSFFGQANHLSELQGLFQQIIQPGFVEQKCQEARRLAVDLTEPVSTHTALPLFDAYCRQTFLDNVLRGGWPLTLGLGENCQTYHVYSRKHGDPERDYNAFFLAAEPYSQGNGSYRDINQNRRSDVFFNPRAGADNIRMFLSLIQLDGYNPLVVKGSRFTLPLHSREQVLARLQQPQPLADLFERPFTPGEVVKLAGNPKSGLKDALPDFLNLVMSLAVRQNEADFGEGYWMDHWFYNLDLIDSYLAVFPDRKQELLFGVPGIPCFDSPWVVKPRARRHVLVGGKVRQYGAVVKNTKKQAQIENRREQASWVRNRQGHIFQTSVMARLVGLAIIKSTLLDPLGMGIEMEGGRPGWYDALNGLPGLFGSSLNETLELQRLLQFLIGILEESPGSSVELPLEQADLLDAVYQVLISWREGFSGDDDFNTWDALSTVREVYYERICLGVDGAMQPYSSAQLLPPLKCFLSKVQAGVRRARQAAGGSVPTYFTYTVKDYQALTTPEGQPVLDEAGRQCIRVDGFSPEMLPLFLEGFVHALKVAPNQKAAEELHQIVRSSGLFDRELSMYRVNCSLQGQSFEIGRARAFPPGWLENESIWLHMEYKYLLELLKAGLTEAFYADLKTTLVPFLDAAVYGRSPLENSSFIASSAHPDPTLHGAGFVARLTGATAEFLSIWNIMMAGKTPFRMQDGRLCLAFEPKLAGWLFEENGQLSFTFMGSCRVTYHNPQRRDTFAAGMQVQKMIFHLADGRSEVVTGGQAGPELANLVRQGLAASIEVEIG